MKVIAHNSLTWSSPHPLVPTHLFQHFYREFSPFEDERLKLFLTPLNTGFWITIVPSLMEVGDSSGFNWWGLLKVHSEEGEVKMILWWSPLGQFYALQFLLLYLNS